MGRIIALQGRAQTGKTTTISMLPDILRANGYHQVAGMYQNHSPDFLDVFDNGVKKVGITSSGDTYDLVHDRLTDLVNAQCDVCICACRTYDRIPPGTVAAVNSFQGYIPQYVPKTITASVAQEPIVNANDAHIIFSLI